MTIVNLPFTKKQKLARKIKRLVEENHNGVNKERQARLTKETEIRRLVLDEEQIIVSGMSDIITILKSNYVKKNVDKILSKIQGCVVWDTSICNMPSQKLEELFFNNSENNVFTSLTFSELLKLSTSNNYPTAIKNANFLIENIIKDVENKYCSTVDIPKKGYVDTQLIEYCVKNQYSLYTRDFKMALRAKSQHVNVSTFYSNDNTIKYEPSNTPNSKHIILEEDLLNDFSIHIIIDLATQLKAKKFILKHSFIECLENFKFAKVINISKLVRFFLDDIDNKYSIFLDSNESTLPIDVLAKKHDAIVFTSSMEKCFDLKCKVCNYMYVTNCANINTNCTTATNVDNTNTISTTDTNLVNTNTTATNLTNTNTSTTDTNISNKIIKLPYFSPTKKCLHIKRLKPNQKIWVLDFNNTEIKIKTKTKLPILDGYTVIYGENTLDEHYHLKVFSIKKKNKNLVESLKFSADFDKNSIDTLSKDYRRFANILTLMT